MHLSHITCLPYITWEEPGIGQAFWEHSRAGTGWKRICPEFRVVGWIQGPQEADNEELLGYRLELTTAADRCFGTMLAMAGRLGAWRPSGGGVWHLFLLRLLVTVSYCAGLLFLTWSIQPRPGCSGLLWCFLGL